MNALMEAARTTILLVEDHAIVRQGLRLLLETETDFEVVGEAPTIRELTSLAMNPDVVIADLMLKDGNGADVILGIRAQCPRAKILVLTMVDGPVHVQGAIAAGAGGYLLKDAAAEELVAAVRKVARGERYLQPSLGADVVRGMTQAQAQLHNGGQLSTSELEVLKLLARGHTNAEASCALSVSQRTVESHRAHIMQKLGFKSRSDLVRYALHAGLLQFDQDE